MSHATYFISDLHLSPNQPAITQHLFDFLNFLESSDETIDALYILGDLFNVWIGDDDPLPYQNPGLQRLSNFSSRCPVFFLHGNRDFLVGKKFSEKTNLFILPEHFLLDLYGIKTLLIHGDQLCTEDLRYQRFRQVVRTRWIQRFFLSCPLWLRNVVAQKLRSQQTELVSPAPYLDATENAIDNLFATFKISFLIHGHTHQPQIQPLKKPDQTRVVLGDWRNDGAMVLKVNSQQQISLFHFKGS